LQVLAITADNASNNDSMCNSLENYFQELGVDFTAKNNQIRCLGHVINLAAQSLLKSMECDNTTSERDIFDDDQSYEAIPAIKKVS
jgi:hypothetical protein